MTGWRAKIGLIVPSVTTVNEWEWNGALPRGVSLHTARMPFTDASLEALDRMEDGYERGVHLLGTAGVDVVVYACTTGSLSGGRGYDTAIEATIEEIADVPGVSTAAAIRRAFDALEMESLAIATPYSDEVNRAEVAFLEAYGYEVVDVHGLGVTDPEVINSRPPRTAYRQVKEQLAYGEADGVFISCTGYPTFEVIEALEADLDVPVVSSNQATLWDTLKTVDVSAREIELGRLFER